MPLVPLNNLLADARAHGRALCYCESWSLDSFQAVLEAAEESGEPTIAGFNGAFLAHPSRRKPEQLALYSGAVAVARSSIASVALLLNETDDFTQIAEGIDLGFNAVMVENAHLGPEDYRSLVKRVVTLAHGRGVCVEAQLGRLPDGWDGNVGSGQTTRAAEAAQFVADTAIDALGVSIGNVHILTRGKAVIDLEVLRLIRAAVDTPLVVHGGTGFPVEQAPAAIALGVAKFNFGTNLKQVYLATLRERLSEYGEPMNPHPFLGMGGKQDILVAARDAVKLKVKELMRTYGNPKATARIM
jgi:fructose/tagatose bisphosphate aldolase